MKNIHVNSLPKQHLHHNIDVRKNYKCVQIFIVLFIFCCLFFIMLALIIIADDLVLIALKHHNIKRV